MSDDTGYEPEDETTSVERLLGRSLVGGRGDLARPLSDRARQAQRSVEAYLKAGARPRWMDRLVEIDQGVANERRSLERSYGALRDECGHDHELFARRWRALAQTRRFDRLNELIDEHNEWYPVERDLPMDPRTGDYVRVHGRSHRRPVLGPAWVLEHFPAERPARAEATTSTRARG